MAQEHFERKSGDGRMTAEDTLNRDEIFAVTAYQAEVAQSALAGRPGPDATEFPPERLQAAHAMAFQFMNMERGDRMAKRGGLRSIFGEDRNRGRLHPSFGPRTDDGPDIEPRYRSFDRT